MFSQFEIEGGCENLTLVNKNLDDRMIDKDMQIDLICFFRELHLDGLVAYLYLVGLIIKNQRVFSNIIDKIEPE